jgi:hypothetical protein
LEPNVDESLCSSWEQNARLRISIDSGIDRFYLSDYFIGKGHRIGIQPSTMLSNNAPVILKFNTKRDNKTFGCCDY